MFRRKLNKALAIVVAAATVATSIMPASAYAAEIEDVVVVETEDATDATEDIVEEDAEVVEEVTTDEQEASVEDTEVSEEALAALADGEYTFDALTLFQDATHDNGEESDLAYDDATKSVTVSFTKQFGQLIYNIPSELDGKIITKATWNIETVPAGADFATKLITDEANWWDSACEAGVQYGSLSASAKDDESGAKVKHVTLMTGSNCTATAEDPVTVTIKSITFEAKDVPVAGPVISEGEYTFDAITLFQDATHDNGEESDLAYDDATKSVTVSFTKQFGQLIYNIPDELDGKIITKATWNIETVPAGADFATKLITDEANWWDSACEAGVQYGSLSVSANDDESGAKVKHVTLMTGSNSTATAEEPVTVTIKSITFVAKEISAEPEENDNEFTFDKLVSAGTEGAEISIDEETGELTVTMTRQYGQAFFKIPEKYNDDIIQSIVWNLSSGSGKDGITVKIHTEDNFLNDSQKSGDVSCKYGSNIATVDDEELGIAARYITIMTTSANATADSPVVMKFKSVTINAKSSAREIKDDIMAGFNGNFETVGENGWWSDGSWSRDNIAYVDYTAEDEAPAEDCNNKYLKVLDPEAVGNADSQRPTVVLNTKTGLACGKAYEFSFWARLDEETGEVESPKINLAIQMHPNGDWDNSVIANVEFDRENVLTSEWKRYSGTISLLDLGNSSMDESKISVYSVDGVVFDIDKLSIGKTNVKHVEKNIPDFYKEVAKQGIPMSGVAISSSTLNDEMAMELVYKHFNSISCENAMKPEVILGSAPKTPVDSVDDLTLHFEEPDKTCDAVAAHNASLAEGQDKVRMRGHVMVWHSQTPTWFFREGFQSNGAYVSKEEMNQRIDDYIRRVAKHFDEKYPGLIYAWDVVNEQASDGSGIRMGTDWSNVYGGSDEYIIQAFKSADEYLAEDIILFYNDYNECNYPKYETIVGFLKKIRANISEDRKLGAGMQGHHDMATPSADAIEKAVRAYAEVADVIHVTELDIKSTVGFDGTNLEQEFINNANRYKEVYGILEKVNNDYEQQKVQCVTIWGTHDKVSWLKTSNNVGGSADGKTPQYPLIFDDYYQAKPAFWAIIDPNGENSEHALPPTQQSITVFESFDKDPFAKAKVYELKSSGDLKANFAMAYVDGKVKVKVVVKGNDTTADINAAALFFDDGMYIADDADIDPTEDGYVAYIDVDKSVEAGKTYLFDVVVVNGATSIAFNDTTLQQEETNAYWAKVTFKECISIPRGTITVDGKVDSAWDNYANAEMPLEIKGDKPVATGAVKYLWDESNLYVLMNVVDDTIDVTAVNEYEQDSIEIFIDENNGKTGSFENDDKQYRVSATNHQSFNGSKCKAENIKSAVVETENGYLLEAAIAWTDIKPVNGTMIGLDIQINDGQGGRRIGTVNLFDGTGHGYESTASYGTAALTGEDTEELNIQYIDDVVYTGKAVKPEVVVRQAGVKLVAGKDYTLTYKNNVKVAAKKGDGLKDNFDDKLPTVIVTGRGNFKGQVKANFSIVKADFSNALITCNYSVPLSAKAQKPAVTVKYLNAVVPKTNYTVKYLKSGAEEATDSIAANDYGLFDYVITANDDSPFTGSQKQPFRILSKEQKNVSKLTVVMPKSKEYTGGPITFATADKDGVKAELVVKDGTKVLEEDKDYTVAYDNNTKIGKASVIIIGNEDKYFGSVSKTFNITGKPVSKLRVTVSGNKADYTGSEIKMGVTVYDGTETVPVVEDDAANGIKVAYANNVMPGTATMTITGCGKYTGTVKKTFTIAGTPVSKLKVTVSGNKAAYTGNPIEMGVTVYDGIETVPVVKDAKASGVKVEYANNTNPGIATMTITGCGKYTGSVKRTFTITGFNFAAATITKPANVPYTGKAYKKIDLEVKYKVSTDEMVEFFSTADAPVEKGATVVLDPKYYTVSLVKGGTDAGAATYKVTGNGIFSGSKNVIMTIDKVDANAEGSTVSMNNIKAVTYNKGNNKPAVTVKFGTKTLNAGKDYTVAYSKNVNVTTDAVAKVTFKGNFKGTLSKTFEIKKAVIDDSYLTTTKDVVANTKVGTYKSTITVAKPDGNKLAANTDYDATGIKYYMNEVNEDNLITATNLKDKKAELIGGTKMIAVISGKNNYEGSVNAEFYLVDAMATSATVKIKDQTFTGRSIELKDSDFTATVKVAGKVKTLEYGKDFTIRYLDDCKTAGVHKIEIVPVQGGDNTVTLGGTKTVTVRINPRNMTWSQDAFLTIQNILKSF